MKNRLNSIKLNKRTKIILILLLITVLIPVGITFSKYVYNFIENYLIKTNNFYFNSDKLGSPNINYGVNNWSGSGNFTIQFELNNHKNNLLVSDSDIVYDVTFTCSSDVICSIDNSSGVIYKTEMTDNFVLTVTPQRIFNAGESIEVDIKATSKSPYVKTLGAHFTITVGKQGVSYEIKDQINQPYFDFSITNARDEYIVREAFDRYSANEIISADTYKKLSDANKEKCYSTLITLSFDPHEVVIDTTSNILNHATYTTQRVGGVDYVSSITFDVEAMSSNVLRFYKIDVTNDYTYPYQNNESIVTFDAI